MEDTRDLNIRETTRLITPISLLQELPISPIATETVLEGRKIISSILEQKDPRMLLIVGPCSIHDEKSAIEFANRLQHLHHAYKDKLFIVMRVYFEKPRTTIGWKGFINDPHLDGSHDIQSGLKKSRKILLEINSMGLPTATELLDPIVPQYISDLITWTAIGARTTESQTHREMASGLSMPVGFKNNTDGNLQSAIDALTSSKHPHSFLGIDSEGRISIVKTGGNPSVHVILRGGRLRPNYDPVSVKETVEKLRETGIDPANIMVDCSHANSNKIPERQEDVWKSIIDQRVAGNSNLIGLMLESHLFSGSQKLPSDPSKLDYGISITDACIGWESTESLIKYAYDKM